MTDDRKDRAPEGDERPETPEGRIEGPLDAAQAGDDQERLKVLEELYTALESELEGDLDQEKGSPRH